ncbi:hypothetical protein VKT23_008270 [Stygiomarasmius scandens]|uniref:Uncharacterized protein n=1 Tax=Marasmiellus scandens TaxID=2682957 RepID=A0ABR1JN49_9AGAR
MAFPKRNQEALGANSNTKYGPMDITISPAFRSHGQRKNICERLRRHAATGFQVAYMEGVTILLLTLRLSASNKPVSAISEMSSAADDSRRTALVTGAGQGIGEAIALRLAKDGLDVAVNDIQGNLEKVTALSEKITAMGCKSSVHIADVSEESQVANMIENVVKKHGSLDVMVANAGIVLVQPLFETTVEQWDKIFAINVRGVFLCYKYAGKQMVAQGRGGRMVGACSVAGKRGNTTVNYSAYVGTKFAVRGITQAAAAELGPHGITVNAYAPGLIDTALSRHMDDRISELSGCAPGTLYKSYAERSLLGCNGAPQDVAGLVSYLVSKEAHFITGQSVCINGGTFCD